MIDPAFDKHLSRRRRIKHLLWWSARLIVLPILRLTIRLRVHGLKNVPRRGGAVIVTNHIDWFDPVLLVAASPRPILWMAKREVFGFPILRWVARTSGAFPVDRGKPDRSALRHAEGLLADGLLVGLFPEGTRSKTGGLVEPYAGASLLVTRTGAPVIPLGITGSEHLPLAGRKPARRRRYPKIDAAFGEPFHLETRKDDGTRWSLEELTDAMMIELARLLPEQYRGIYAERAKETHPAVRRDRIVFTGPGSDY
jgi:1-acyl-sn-glycerol-3-phosphate acyltransferase